MTTTSVRGPQDFRAAWAGLLSAAAFIGVIGVAGALFTTDIPRPTDAPSETLTFFRDNASVLAWGAVVRLIAAVLLVVFATHYARAVRRADARSSGLADATVAGAVLAAAFVAVSVLLGVVLGGLSDDAHPSTVDALRQLNFLTGGAGHTMWLGLLAAAMSWSARRTTMLPRWLTTAGLVAGTLGMLSMLSVATDAAILFIPIGRFSALLVIGLAAVLLATGRGDQHNTSRWPSVAGGIGVVVLAFAVTIFI